MATPYFYESPPRRSAAVDLANIDFGDNLRAQIKMLFGAGLLSKELAYTGDLVTTIEFLDTDGGAVQYSAILAYTGTRLDTVTITRTSDSVTQTFTVSYIGDDIDKIVVT